MCEVKVWRRGFTLGMLDTHRRKKSNRGKTLYEIMARVERDRCRVVRFPDAATLRILARKHLDSEYEEAWRGMHSFCFLINARVPLEFRELFLYGVAQSTRLILPRCKRTG